MRYYSLKRNPSSQAGKMGKSKAKEMLFWTKDEYINNLLKISPNHSMHLKFCIGADAE
jgi:hypothetical protein